MAARRPVVALLACAFIVGATSFVLADAVPPTLPSERVEHHLRHVDRLSGHFEAVLANGCPRFASRAAWDDYVEGETDRLVLLMAHLEEAWLEAKRTGDDDLRRTAKAPRRQMEQGRQLIDKLQACAERNGASLAPLSVWRRIERDVPRRQTEIALPR